MTSWNSTVQRMAQSLGIALFSMNFAGGLMMIILFSTQHLYRTKPSTFFILLAAIAGCIQLLAGTIGRIVLSGFNVDLTSTSIVLCKLRQYVYATCPGIALTFNWLSAVDQFLVTSRHVRLRQFSKIKLAHQIAKGVILFWILHNLPFLIFTNIQLNMCIVNNSIFQLYYTYLCFWLLFTAIPIIMLTTFGVLTYRNVRSLTNVGRFQNADRQLTIMVCAQVGSILISVMPTTIFNIYSLSTSEQYKSDEQKSLEYFVVNLFGFISTFEFGGSFYLFLAVSSRFRQQVKRYFCRCCFKQNVVQPTNVIVRNQR